MVEFFGIACGLVQLNPDINSQFKVDLYRGWLMGLNVSSGSAKIRGAFPLSHALLCAFCWARAFSKPTISDKVPPLQFSQPVQ